MDGKFENVANQFNALILPMGAILILIVGIATIIYGIYIIRKNKKDGLRYIGTGIGIIDVSNILLLLFILSDDIKNFNKTDNGIIFVGIVAILLFFIAFIILKKSNIKD